MDARADLWERARRAARESAQAAPSRNALACRRKRERYRAAGLCVFCGERPAASLCEVCRRTQGEQRRELYRLRVEREEGRRVRPYVRRCAT